MLRGCLVGGNKSKQEEALTMSFRDRGKERSGFEEYSYHWP